MTAEQYQEYVAWSLSEKAWQQQIVDLAESQGYWGYHAFNSERSEPGFPDLVLLREGRTIFAEVKRMGEHLTPEQAMVCDLLLGNGLEVYAWWPDDEEEVTAVLVRGERRSPW